MTNTCIEFNHVTKRYLRRLAVNDIQFSIGSGKIVGLIGPNGSGKSTILKLAAGLTRPTSGSVIVLGASANRNLSNHVSYMSDQADLYPFYTIREMITFFDKVFADFNQDRARELLEFMELDPHQRIHGLSKGNLGRLKITLAISRRTPLILMDEPLSGLDPMVRQSIIKGLIAYLDLEHQTLILSTHEVAEIEPLLDQVLLVHNGSLVALDDVEAIQAQSKQSLVHWMAENI